MTIIHGFGGFRRHGEEGGEGGDTEQGMRDGGKGDNCP